jgi:hypothetical protein
MTDTTPLALFLEGIRSTVRAADRLKILRLVEAIARTHPGATDDFIIAKVVQSLVQEGLEHGDPWAEELIVEQRRSQIRPLDLDAEPANRDWLKHEQRRRRTPRTRSV